MNSRSTALDLSRWLQATGGNMKWTDTPQLYPKAFAEHCVHHLLPELRHNLSRQLGLMLHGASSKRQSARSRVRATQQSHMRSLSTSSGAAGEQLTGSCRLGLAGWPQEAAPSDDPQWHGFESRRCHPCVCRAQRGNSLGCTPRSVATTDTKHHAQHR